MSRRSSGAGRTIKLVIQHAPAAPTVNPLTEPLMAKAKETSPKKAKF